MHTASVTIFHQNLEMVAQTFAENTVSDYVRIVSRVKGPNESTQSIISNGIKSVLSLELHEAAAGEQMNHHCTILGQLTFKFDTEN